MKEKLMQIKKSVNRSSHSKYGFLLSIVALVEIIMIISVSTFSWVETISSIKISNEGKVANIDTYTFTGAHIGTDYTESIDLSKYFRASGNAHLSAASSANGIDFFFPKVASVGSAAKAYRKGTINDKNTNYISFSFKVTADGSNQNFFFDNQALPRFYADGALIDNDDIRVALTVADSNGNTETRIYSYKSGTYSVVADVNGGFVTQSTINAFEDFSDNKSQDPDKMLFSVDKDETKTITVTMWLQDFATTDERDAYSGKTISASGFKIVTATKMTLFTFVDKTSGFNSTEEPIQTTWQWVSNDNAKMWLQTASGNSYEMTKAPAEAGSEPKWTVSIPSEKIGDYSGDMFFYRTASTVTENPKDNYLNYWKTKFADNKEANPVYTAYGAKLNDSGLVNGTWGKLSEIQLLADGTNILPTPKPEEKLYITQVTLKNSNNIAVEMNFNNGCWRAYIPKDDASKDLKFSFNGYNISASNRDTSEDVSKYCVTSPTTGYWDPPAEVQVFTYSPHSDRGSVKVSGGAENATWVKVTKGTQVTVTATPKADYAFEGWYTNEDCTELASQGHSSSFTITADSTTKTYKYYAKFQYNVRLTVFTDNVETGSTGVIDGGKVQINDGTPGAKVSAPVKDGSQVTLTAIPDTENFEFDGWYDYSTKKPVVDDSGNPIKDTEFTIKSLDKPINYYAHYKVKYFTLEAYAATTGGQVKFSSQSDDKYSSYANVSVKFTDKVQFMAKANDAEGYDFMGWYSDEACTDRVCCQAATDVKCDHANYEVDKTDTDDNNNLTLYAKFVLRKYTVRAVAVKGNTTTASDEGGTVKITVGTDSTAAGKDVNKIVTHGNRVTFEATAKNSAGYKFAGWYDKDGNPVNTTDAKFTTEKGVAGDIEYYARFTKGTTIYFTDYYAEEEGFDAYAAYLYSAISEGNWPGKLISHDNNGNITTDDATGYCVYTNDTVESGNFNIIINNNKEDKDSAKRQYPRESQPGLVGTCGNTYFFGNSSQTVMTSFTPISVSVNAVTYDENGSIVTDGFSGGSIKVGFNTYTAAKTLSRQSGDTFYATAQPASGYKFDGWYTDESCTNQITEGVTDQKLKSVPVNGTEYYAKFVESASTDKITIYFTNSNNHKWQEDSIYCYAWKYGTDDRNAAWRGVQMTKTSETNNYGEYIYTIEIDSKYDTVIFSGKNSSNGEEQTVDITLGEKRKFYLSGEKDGSKFKYSTY